MNSVFQPSPISIAVLALVTCPLSVLAQHASVEDASKVKRTVWDQRLEEVLPPLAENHAGEVSYEVRILDANHEILAKASREAQKPMPSASLIKLPVMVEAYSQAEENRIELSKRLRLTEQDKVPGSGILNDHFDSNLELSVRDAIRLMMRYSDNTATNLVIDQIGLGSTGDRMRRMGYPDTQLHAKVFRSNTSIAPERSREFGLGSVTAQDLVNLLSLIEKRELLSPDACEAMLGHLLSCEDSLKLPRFLPAGTKLAHKTGSVTRSRTAAGIIYGRSNKIVLCVLTTNNEDGSWSDENAADVLIGKLAKSAFDRSQAMEAEVESSHLLGSEDRSMAQTTLEQGAHGPLVEGLQRTLNAVHNAGLTVDGDFGPATAAAVASFQKSVDLPPDSIVDERTWRKLGPIVSAKAVPPPELVNAEKLERSSAWSANQPPQTSAKAHVIMDASRGTVFAAKSPTNELANASTTKLMSALLIAELAAESPGVLQEEICFSKRADNTIGSTAGVRAGESLTCRELLYGLLLPSGNDASVALAEHFGTRVFEQVSGQNVGPLANPNPNYVLFVEAMNQRAEQLAMAHTSFANPHGLTEQGHFSCAADLAILAQQILKHQLLMATVSTRQRGCRLRGVGGYTRDVVWKNTNRLLRFEEFSGMKTGTTSAAGACLVSVGELDGIRLIAVVLGCPSSDARYSDTRNLFDWAWRTQRVAIGKGTE
jgi:D-alanyl-D-alanine carboxypeptidase (penicillin-binding protein 5/6)